MWQSDVSLSDVLSDAVADPESLQRGRCGEWPKATRGWVWGGGVPSPVEWGLGRGCACDCYLASWSVGEFVVRELVCRRVVHKALQEWKHTGPS